MERFREGEAVVMSPLREGEAMTGGRDDWLHMRAHFMDRMKGYEAEGGGGELGLECDGGRRRCELGVDELQIRDSTVGEFNVE